MSHAENNMNDDNKVERYAGGFLMGVLKVAGYSVLAVIAGYSAGVAFNNCVNKSKIGGFAGSPSH